jgi:hypothetical protein
MVINHRARWIYLDVPRTGSTSMCAYLCQPELGGIQAGERHHYEIDPAWEDYFTFATVRHPFPRAVSLWLHFVQDYRARCDPSASETGNWPFVRYVEEVLIERRTGIPFYHKACHEWLDPVHRVDRILKSEELDPALARLGLNSGQGPVTLPRLNSVPRAPWQTYYTPELLALVRYWAAEDFERYGYD